MKGRHPLDRPAWSALAGRQSHLSRGNDYARRYDPDVSPFAAACDDEDRSLAALGALVAPGERIYLMQVGEIPEIPGLMREREAQGVQMVAQRLLFHGECAEPIVQLSDAHVPAMRELAAFTEPGPFAARTHEMGNFYGVFDNDRLVAMAGERMKPDGYTEVSGVCTHPEYRGRGYARFLSYLVAAAIVARGETPFLHAWATNHAAIRLYETLGFTHRTMVTVNVLRK